MEPFRKYVRNTQPGINAPFVVSSISVFIQLCLVSLYLITGDEHDSIYLFV